MDTLFAITTAELRSYRCTKGNYRSYFIYIMETSQAKFTDVVDKQRQIIHNKTKKKNVDIKAVSNIWQRCS